MAFFYEELRGLDNTLSPETATERQFEEGLRRTSFRISSAWSKRTITSEFQGPQQYAQRFSIQRVHFSLDDTFVPRQGLDDKTCINWLLCDSCQKWRRVDVQTMKTYSNDTFHGGARERRCNDLEAKVPSLTPFLTAFLRQRKLETKHFILTQTNLAEAFENASSLLQSLLHDDAKRGVYELSCTIAANIYNNPKDKDEAPIDSTDIESWISERTRDDQNVLFTCTSLVNVDTCDTPCDFQTASNTCFSFSSQSFANDHELLVSDNDTSCEYSAVIGDYLHCSCPTEAIVSLEPYCCVVVGCPVVHADTNFKKGKMFQPKSNRLKTTHTISGL